MTIPELGFLFVVMLGILIATLWSLGWGFVALLTLGYFNGVIRANYLGIATTFMFDAALLGLYLGFFVFRPKDSAGVWQTAAGQWTLALILWPVLLTFLPVNHFLVQLVALRATVWFLPVLLVAVRLREGDLAVIARGVAVLNLVALAGALYVYQNGVESLYPDNSITQVIYRSKDVVGFTYHRIPSIFLSAHAYGGAMLLSLPFVLDRLCGRKVWLADRVLCGAGVVAAITGILMCASRSPVVVFGVATVVAWVVSRFNVGIGVTAAAVVGLGIAVAGASERLQRAVTLEDTEFVSDRVHASANVGFFDLIVDYPAGAGMGSSYGTSIPYFLADRAPKAIGLENEYSRILVDQGLVGLGIWLAFLVWLLHRPPPIRFALPWGFGVVFMYALVLVLWGTAFIGAGMLSSIPGSVLLLLQMGVLVRVRAIAMGRVP